MTKITKYINTIHRSSIASRCAKFEPYGIYGYQISYLIAIYKHPGLSQDNLAEFMFVNKSTIARNIKTLIDEGYAKSEVDKDDKRINRIYPTEKLIDFFPEIANYLEEWNNNIQQDLTEEEKKVFGELLIKVANRAYNITKEGTNA